MVCAFEMNMVSCGVNEYWGPHVLRVFNYPVIIATLEPVQAICFAVGAVILRQRATQTIHLLALFVMFPAFCIMGNLRVRAPQSHFRVKRAAKLKFLLNRFDQRKSRPCCPRHYRGIVSVHALSSCRGIRSSVWEWVDHTAGANVLSVSPQGR